MEYDTEEDVPPEQLVLPLAVRRHVMLGLNRVSLWNSNKCKKNAPRLRTQLSLHVQLRLLPQFSHMALLSLPLLAPHSPPLDQDEVEAESVPFAVGRT